jgi:hypothetical protein
MVDVIVLLKASIAGIWMILQAMPSPPIRSPKPIPYHQPAKKNCTLAVQKISKSAWPYSKRSPLAKHVVGRTGSIHTRRRPFPSDLIRPIAVARHSLKFFPKQGALHPPVDGQLCRYIRKPRILIQGITNLSSVLPSRWDQSRNLWRNLIRISSIDPSVSPKENTLLLETAPSSGTLHWLQGR